MIFWIFVLANAVNSRTVAPVGTTMATVTVDVFTTTLIVRVPCQKGERYLPVPYIDFTKYM